MPDRTYSKEEIAALLERAAELHAQEAKSTSDKPGLTLSEIEEVAAESGIDPLLVRQAATEMKGAPRAASLKTKEATATHNIVERIIPGVLKPEAWEDIVMDLRLKYDSSWDKMMGMQESKTEQIGRSVQWSYMSSTGVETRVVIRPRGNKLHLVVKQRVGWGGTIAESITYGSTLAFVAAVFTGAIVESSIIGALVAIVMLGLSIPLIYKADKAWRKKKHREIDSLADSISNILVLSQTDTESESNTISLEEYTGKPEENLLEQASHTSDEEKPLLNLDDDTLDQSQPKAVKKSLKNK